MRRKFAYLRAGSAAEACELKSAYGEAARFLAGGTDLILSWKRGLEQFDVAIDITALSELRFIAEQDGELRIGSLATLADLADATPVNALTICIRSAARRMATPQLRTTATLGGNICHASPCADMAVILTMFEGSAVLRSVKGERVVPMAEFFLGNKATVVRDELLTEVRMPLPDRPTRAVFKRAVRSSIDLAQASAGVCLSADDSKVAAASIAVGACAPVPVRPRAAEEVLVGMDLNAPDEQAIALAADRAQAATTPICDVRAGDVYRRDVTRVLVRRAINECLSQLTVQDG